MLVKVIGKPEFARLLIPIVVSPVNDGVCSAYTLNVTVSEVGMTAGSAAG